ncbi:MAG: DNA repair protein RecO [Oscillospiraceae bacterium]|nr:DNA repair protein RecO [Oscillospiraceae bacterium]
MQIMTDGLVIGEKIVGESDRLVTLLTREEGILRAFAPQAKNLKNSKVSSTQLLCYSQFVLYKGKDKYVVNDGQAIEVFFGLRRDIESLSLAQYFCELASLLAPQESEAGDFLRLILNGLSFLSSGTRPHLLLKPVVEMRLLALAGFMPNLIGCDTCGVYESDPMYFLPGKGVLYCKDCIKDAGERSLAVAPGVLTALRHTIYAEFQKLFSFSLQPEGLKQLSQISETYLLHIIGRRIPTLEFYHQMASLGENV